MKRCFTILLLLVFLLPAKAKTLGVNIAYGRYMTENKQAYLELYFAINARSLRYTSHGSGTYRGTVDVLLTFSNKGNNVAASRFRIHSNSLTDTTQGPEVLLHQERIALPQDRHLMFIQITDANDSMQSYPLEQYVDMRFDSTAVSGADLILLEHFEEAKSPSAFSKSGFNLYPIVSAEIAQLPPSMEKLNFYTELYNLETTLGEKSRYAYRYYLTSAKTKEALNNYGRLNKEVTAPLKPILGQLSLEGLPTGIYYLRFEVLNEKGEMVYEKQTPFLRQAPLRPMADIIAHAANNPNNFARHINEVDSLYQCISYLYTVSNDVERQTQKEIKERKEKAEMQHYLFAFFEQKFPGKAEESWAHYMVMVRYVNTHFGTMIRKGFLTERGRVYLTYGAPSQMEDRKVEPSLPPYQIWHYHGINSPWAITQSNRIFVFAEFNPSSNAYELIHSSAIGETRNDSWRYQLSKGYFGGRGNLDNKEVDMADEFGSRVNENNLIMNRGN